MDDGFGKYTMISWVSLNDYSEALAGFPKCLCLDYIELFTRTFTDLSRCDWSFYIQDSIHKVFAECPFLYYNISPFCPNHSFPSRPF